MSQENLLQLFFCLLLHACRERGAWSAGSPHLRLAQAAVVPLIPSSIYPPFINFLKRVVLLGDNKCKELLLKMCCVKKIGPELQHKSNICIDSREAVPICTHGSLNPLCLDFQHFREQRWQNTYCFPEKKHTWTHQMKVVPNFRQPPAIPVLGRAEGTLLLTSPPSNSSASGQKPKQENKDAKRNPARTLSYYLWKCCVVKRADENIDHLYPSNTMQSTPCLAKPLVHVNMNWFLFFF